MPDSIAERGLPKLAVVLDDPRLSAASESAQARDWSGAARAVEAVSAAVTLDGAQSFAWNYVAGRLYLAAGEAGEASAAFERALATKEGAGAYALAAYAALRDAQALVRLGRFDEAIAQAKSAIAPPWGSEIAGRDEAELALADAYAGKSDRASAVPVWRSVLSAAPHGARWVDTAIQLATALLDGVDGRPELRAQEALDLATRVVVEAPAIAERADVVGLRTRAAMWLGRRAPPPLTASERAVQAQAWLDAALPKRAIEAADALLKGLPAAASDHPGAACKAAIVRAQSKPRGKADDSADAWGVAIARCAGDEGLATALYYGGKASASAHRPAQAFERFGKVEKLFPKHRLADDACFRAAVLACDGGDESRGLAKLLTLPDTYPEGDMGGEALFRVALARLERQDLAGARDALDRSLASGLEAGRAASGRGAYFRARVAQLAGDVDDAANRYAAMIADQPLGYYMLLAYARLRAISDAQALAALEASAAREPSGPFLTRDHPELASPGFERFVRLLEVGEVELARREAHAAGLFAEGIDPEVLWAVAWAYDRAGLPEIGHSFTRARLTDYRAHWPVGRWRLPWEVAFPRAWEALVGRESDATHISATLTWAIMREESAFNSDARSVADAIGLMQLIVPTARATARGTSLPFDEDSLRRPQVSIALGTRLLSSLRASFPSNPALAIAAYNGGPHAVRRWLGEHGRDDFDVFVERIPFDETRAYVKRVLASQAAYAYLYAPKALDELLALTGATSSQLIAAP